MPVRNIFHWIWTGGFGRPDLALPKDAEAQALSHSSLTPAEIRICGIRYPVPVWSAIETVMVKSMCDVNSHIHGGLGFRAAALEYSVML